MDSDRAGRIPLVGGNLALDFLNTASWRGSEHPSEWLTSYAALLAWSRHAGALTAQECEELEREAAREPRAAAAALERARELREALFRIFVATVEGWRPEPADLEMFNAALAGALGKLRVEPAERGFSWRWREEPALDRMLLPVLRSAAELLTAPERERVKVCSGEGCGWLFLDVSRNRSRRWCDMADCGNRAKARRHYARKRSSS